MNVYYAERHVCNTFAELLRLLTHQLKDCNNGQDKGRKRLRCLVAEIVYYKAPEIE